MHSETGSLAVGQYPVAFNRGDDLCFRQLDDGKLEQVQADA